MHNTESDFPSENDPAQVGRYLEAWITGRPLGDIRAMAFVAESELVQPALALLGKGDIAIVPAGSDIRGFSGKTVEYLGRFVDVGDEMTIDGRSIEMQDYLAASFVEVLGPTAVRMNDETGWEAFLADADSAFVTGTFVSQLRNPSLLLAGRQAFLSSAEPVLFRPYFLPDGTIRNGPEGLTIGRVGDPETELAPSNRVSLQDEFGGIANGEAISAAVSLRPWLARYIRAYELAVRVHATPSMRIAGFGFAVADDDQQDRTPSADQPFLYEENGSYVVADLRTGRRTGVGREGAIAVDIALSSSSAEVAAGRLSRLLDVTETRAAGLLCEVGQYLSIGIGGRQEDAEATA